MPMSLASCGGEVGLFLLGDRLDRAVAGLEGGRGDGLRGRLAVELLAVLAGHHPGLGAVAVEGGVHGLAGTAGAIWASSGCSLVTSM